MGATRAGVTGAPAAGIAFGVALTAFFATAFFATAFLAERHGDGRCRLAVALRARPRPGVTQLPLQVAHPVGQVGDLVGRRQPHQPQRPVHLVAHDVGQRLAVGHARRQQVLDQAL
nr:hypothetical protein GCM10020092_030770 [Actinoplanes digitatis]